jgi:hypothetical protein
MASKDVEIIMKDRKLQKHKKDSIIDKNCLLWALQGIFLCKTTKMCKICWKKAVVHMNIFAFN